MVHRVSRGVRRARQRPGALLPGGPVGDRPQQAPQPGEHGTPGSEEQLWAIIRAKHWWVVLLLIGGRLIGAPPPYKTTVGAIA